MQQDHVEAKAEKKSGNSPARAKASPDLTSQARAVLNLQNTAGNRALARILAGPAQHAPLQRMMPTSGLSVQRDELTDAIQNEIGQGLAVDYKSLARMLVRSWQATDSEPVEESRKASVTESATESATEKAKAEPGRIEAPTEKAKKADKIKEPDVPLTPEQLRIAVNKKKEEVERSEKLFREGPSDLDREMESLKRREELAKLRLRQKALAAGKSPTDLALEERGEELTAREGEKSEADKLRKEEAALKRPQTAIGRANAAKRAELDEIKKSKKAEGDRAEKRKQLAEEKRKLSGQLTPEERADQELDEQLAAAKKGSKADQDRKDKRKQLAELKRKLNGELTPQEKADQELDDQLADLKKQQEDDEKMRQFERQRKPLNPGKQSLTQILGGRRF